MAQNDNGMVLIGIVLIFWILFASISGMAGAAHDMGWIQGDRDAIPIIVAVSVIIGMVGFFAVILIIDYINK